MPIRLKNFRLITEKICVCNSFAQSKLSPPKNKLFGVICFSIHVFINLNFKPFLFFLQNSVRRYEHPGFTVRLVLDQSSIKFEPEFKDFSTVFLSIYDVMMKAISIVPRVETRLYSDWVKNKSSALLPSPSPTHPTHISHRFHGVMKGFTRSSMKTKYVCLGIISLHANFRNNRTVSTEKEAFIKFADGGGGVGRERAKKLFPPSHTLREHQVPSGVSSFTR